jgi:hypothetical protein
MCITQKAVCLSWEDIAVQGFCVRFLVSRNSGLSSAVAVTLLSPGFVGSRQLTFMAQ